MNIEHSIKDERTKAFDSLALFHHQHCNFDHKLQILISILQSPKDYKLVERFDWLKRILEPNFGMELLWRLDLIPFDHSKQTETKVNTGHPHDLLCLLHLWCLLDCTDSVEYIARYLELTVEEVQELIREMHHTFNIDGLLARVRQYYDENKKNAFSYEYQKKNEILGIDIANEPKDVAENRKLRLRRKYGCLANSYEVGDKPI